MDKLSIIPKIKVESKADIQYIKSIFEERLHLIRNEILAKEHKRLKEKGGIGLQADELKAVKLLTNKWLERFFVSLGENTTVNGLDYATVMEQPQEYEPLDERLVTRVNHLSQEKDNLMTRLCLKRRVNVLQQMQHSYRRALRKLEPVEYPVSPQPLSPNEDETETHLSQAYEEEAFKRAIQQVQDISLLIQRIDKVMNQVTTELERVATYHEAIAEHSEFQALSEKPLSEAEKEVFELSLTHDKIPEEKLRLPTLPNLNPSISLGLIGTNQRYIGRLLVRNRQRKKLKII